MTNANLEKYEIFYPIKGKTLREQLVGKKLAGVAVMKEIIKRAKKLTLDERLKNVSRELGSVQ